MHFNKSIIVAWLAIFQQHFPPLVQLFLDASMESKVHQLTRCQTVKQKLKQPCEKGFSCNHVFLGLNEMKMKLPCYDASLRRNELGRVH
ncbi:hypothetical protein V6Z12_A05G369700 [Gossypium hirsutum]